MNNLSRFVLTVLLMTALWLGACAAPTAAPAVAPAGDAESAAAPAAAAPSDQTIIVGLADAPTTLDPADHRSRISETVIRNLFDGLVTRDTRNGVHMELAESATLVDPTTWEFKLVQGVKFHDGSEMTADDVVYTFDRIIQENQIEYPETHTSPRKGLIAPLASVEKVDDTTVRFHLSAPWPPAMQLFVHQQIVPKACRSEERRVGKEC